MDLKENIKSGLTFAADTVSEIASSIAEKNRLRTQLNHIKTLIKTDSETRDQAYIELGRYYYDNLREGASAENEAICAVVDAASERISKASLKYMELLNLQNETKIRSENAEKIKKVVAEKASASAKAAKEFAADKAAKAKDFAAETAGKAKDVAAQGVQMAKDAATGIKEKAADTVEEVKERFDTEKSADLEALIAEEQEKMKAAEDAVAENIEKTVEPEIVNEESPDSFSF